MSGSGTANRSLTNRRGSSFTDRQIFAAVKDTKTVVATLHDGSSIEGWICGMDDYHWGIVDSQGQVSLVHKSVPGLKISSAGVDITPVANEVVEPFRDYVMREHFSRTSQPQPALT